MKKAQDAHKNPDQTVAMSQLKMADPWSASRQSSNSIKWPPISKLANSATIVRLLSNSDAVHTSAKSPNAPFDYFPQQDKQEKEG